MHGVGRLSDYQLQDVLGEGSSGRTHRALHRATGQVVAIKLCRRPEDPAEIAEWEGRFAREAHLALRCGGDGLVRTHDAFVEGEQAVLVMELIEGRSLRQHLRERGRLREPEALSLIGRVARAVGRLHQAGVVHRDLKPENVLLRAPGDEPCLVDLGLARAPALTPAITASGDIVGTPTYMAPEQAEGRRALISPATDVWALGVMLHELVAGQPPFVAMSLRDLLRVICDPTVVPPGLPQGPGSPAAQVVARCLARTPGERWSDGGALAAACERVGQAPTPAGPRPSPARNRAPLAVGLAVIGALALLAIALVRRGPEPALVAPSPWLHDPLPARHGGAVRGVSWSREDRCLSVGADGTLFVRDEAGRIDAALVLPTGLVPSGPCALGPGDRLAVACGDDLVCVSEGGTFHRLVGVAARALDFGPDGTWLLTGDERGVIRRVSFPSGAELDHAQAGAAPVRALAVDADGLRLVSGGADGRAQLWWLPRLRPLEVSPWVPNGASLLAVGWAGDAPRAVCRDAQGAVRLVGPDPALDLPRDVSLAGFAGGAPVLLRPGAVEWRGEVAPLPEGATPEVLAAGGQDPLIAVGGRDGQVFVRGAAWSAGTGPDAGPVTGLVALADGRVAASWAGGWAAWLSGRRLEPLALRLLPRGPAGVDSQGRLVALGSADLPAGAPRQVSGPASVGPAGRGCLWIDQDAVWACEADRPARQVCGGVREAQGCALGDQGQAAVWGPEGRVRLLRVDGSGLVEHELPGVVQLALPVRGSAPAAALLASGRLFVLSSPPRAVAVGVTCFEPHPAGFLIAGQLDRTVRLVDPRQGCSVDLLDLAPYADRASALALSPEGGLLVGTERGRVGRVLLPSLPEPPR